MDEIVVQVDRAGRIVLPKPLRDRLRLRVGDFLAISLRGDRIELRPARATRQLQRLNGVLVFDGGRPLQRGKDYVAQSRDSRIEKLTDNVAKGN